MKIKIRTLKNERYEIEVEPSTTVDGLKGLIEGQYKFEKASQTLIFAGKILVNDQKLEDLKIGQDDFLVLTVKLRKPAETSQATAAPASSTTSTVSNNTASSTTTTTSTAAPPPTTSTTASTAPATSDRAEEHLLTGPELEKAVDEIVGMGFSRDKVQAAMRASFNNPERAIDYLTNGFPPSLAAQPTPASRPAPTQTTSQPSTPSGVPSTGVFDGLRQHPQFAQLCYHAQQGGEEALKQILEYFSQVSRPLLELVVQNQEEFIQLLQTPVTAIPSQGGSSGAAPPPRTAGGPTSAPGGAAASPAGLTPGVLRLQVTPEDERVINGLVNMGFDRNSVLEAYFLFDKDEQTTANYLLNNPDRDPGSQ